MADKPQSKKHSETRSPGSSSFSYSVKDEIARIFPERACCRESLLASVLFSIGKPVAHKGMMFEITSGLSGAARLLYRIIKEIAHETVSWEVQKEKFLYKRKMYHIFVPDTPFMKDYGTRWGIPDRLEKKNIRRACCQRAFLVGAFLASGSVNSPDGHYHFEISEKNPEICRVLMKTLSRMEVQSKIVERRNKHIVYVKKADDIANLLNVLGAHSALLKYEEVRAIKETKEEVRRKVNAETSNMDKTAKAATRQVHNIQLLKQSGLFNKLSDCLKNTANYRLLFPEASLKEIGEFFSPPLTKSSVNSQLRRIEMIARSVKTDENILINN